MAKRVGIKDQRCRRFCIDEKKTMVHLAMKPSDDRNIGDKTIPVCIPAPGLNPNYFPPCAKALLKGKMSVDRRWIVIDLKTKNRLEIICRRHVANPQIPRSGATMQRFSIRWNTGLTCYETYGIN